MSLSLKRNAILQSSNLQRVLINKRLRGRNFILASSLNQFQNLKIEKQNGFENFPDAPAIYAVFDDKEDIQYIGITRKLRMSVMGLSRDLPDLTYRVKFETKHGATKEELAQSWKETIEQHVQETGQVPPGNLSGNDQWKAKRSVKPKPEIRLTPGKGIEDLTVGIEVIINQVVKSNKVVAFIKGTRTEPKCGFSYQMLTILNRNRVDYEVVDVLDEVYNPGVREAIKSYSQWPTIPQLFVNGEFIGGTDILTKMQDNGEFGQLVTKL